MLSPLCSLLSPLCSLLFVSCCLDKLATLSLLPQQSQLRVLAIRMMPACYNASSSQPLSLSSLEVTDQSRCREQPQLHPHGYEHSLSLDLIDLSFPVPCCLCPSHKRSINLGPLLLLCSLPAITCRRCLSRATSTNAAHNISPFSPFSSFRSSPHLSTHRATLLKRTTSPNPCNAQRWLDLIKVLLSCRPRLKSVAWGS